jgi:site-specific recombinase XerC
VAVVRLLIDCGLRVSELTGIDIEDLDLDGESVKVTGKGSRVRLAYFGSKTGLALFRYCVTVVGTAMRLTRRCSSANGGRFTTDGVRERLKARAERAGLDPKLVHRTGSATPRPTIFYSRADKSET